MFDTLMLIRASVALQGPQIGLAALKIAFNYGRQRKIVNSQQGKRIEMKLSDQQYWQIKMTPLVALHICQLVGGNYLRRRYDAMLEREKKAQSEDLDFPIVRHLFILLQTSVMQSLKTTLNTARDSCGAAGAQPNSGFDHLFMMMRLLPFNEMINVQTQIQTS
jgi:alkylation response protein AidB-like acyl-CoA dehydrogenase